MPWKATSADVQFTVTGSDGSSRNLDCVERSPERLVSEGSLPRGPIQAGEVVSYTLTASVSHWTGGFLPIGPIAGGWRNCERIRRTPGDAIELPDGLTLFLTAVIMPPWEAGP